MDEGVVRLEPRVARIESDVVNLKETVEKLDRKVDRLDEKVDRLGEKVDHLDKRMTIVERVLAGVGKNQEAVHGDLRDLRGSLDTKFLWIVTTMIVFGTALLAAMAQGFHWLN
jgi:predicted nuclease with TOPRIM domain